jgi:LCP family protein required for cell wall assembly
MSRRNPSGEAYTPFRDVDRASSKQMAKRARWIIVLNFLVPGSAQVVAGNRKLGRLGLFFTFGFWGFLILSLLFALVYKIALFSIFTTAFIAIPLGILFIGYAFLIAILSLDSLRLIRPNTLGSARPIVLVALTITALFSSLIVGTIGSTTISASNFFSNIFTESGSLQQHKGRYNILLLGGDSGSDRFGLRPDSIAVMSISATTGQTVNIGLPRNLTHIQFTKGTPIRKVFPYGFNHDCGGECMLNAIYKSTTDNYSKLYPDARKHGSTPGIEATKSAVQWVTGLKIDAYVLINMKSFTGLVNALGGIEVNVKKALPIGGQVPCDQNLYSQREGCPDAMSWIEKGKQHMDGRTALWYARSRHNTTDYDRMKRQREVESIVLKKIDLPTLVLRFGAIAGASAKLIRTDIPSGSVGELIDLALKAKSKGLKSLQLSYPLIQADNPDFFLMRHLIAVKLRKYK